MSVVHAQLHKAPAYFRSISRWPYWHRQRIVKGRRRTHTLTLLPHGPLGADGAWHKERNAGLRPVVARSPHC